MPGNPTGHGGVFATLKTTQLYPWLLHSVEQVLMRSERILTELLDWELFLLFIQPLSWTCSCALRCKMAPEHFCWQPRCHSKTPRKGGGLHFSAIPSPLGKAESFMHNW